MKAIYGCLLAGFMTAGVQAQSPAQKSIAEGESAGIPAESKGSTNSVAKPDEHAQSLIGKTVLDEQGRELGKVQDLVMNTEKGEVGYVVLQVKGDGEPLKLPVPERALIPGEREGTLVLNISPNVLTALEVYRESELPAPDAFSVDSAVGSAGSSEKGSGSSDSSPKQGEAKQTQKSGEGQERQ